jgi:predicted TIM-barrel fold metal-dependent hydrolase
MTIIDLYGLPTYPAHTWKAGIPKVAGYSIDRQACLPTSHQRATAYAKRHRKNGSRLLRFHHIDKLIKSDPLNELYLQYMLDAAQRQGIPCAIEFASETPLEVPYIQRLCKLDLSNVPLAAITNEKALDTATYAKWEAVIRDAGFTGRLFGSNAWIMGGEFGSIESAHIYTGHPERGYFFNTSFPEHSTHNSEPNLIARRRPDLPFCVMECGARYPNEDRGMSDVRLYRRLAQPDLDARIVCPYTFSSSDIGMGAVELGVDGWGLSADSQRFGAFQYAAQLMQGISDAVPFSNGLRAMPAIGALYENSPTYVALPETAGQ